MSRGGPYMQDLRDALERAVEARDLAKEYLQQAESLLARARKEFLDHYLSEEAPDAAAAGFSLAPPSHSLGHGGAV